MLIYKTYHKRAQLKTTDHNKTQRTRKPRQSQISGNYEINKQFSKSEKILNLSE